MNEHTTQKPLMTAPDLMTLLCEVITSQPIPDQTLAHLQQFSEADWAAWLYTAEQHSLAPMVHHHLRTVGKQLNLPDKIANQFHDAYMISAIRNTLFLHETGRILAAFNQADLPVIGLKGVYLVENLYENIAVRGMADIDLMIRKSDVPDAIVIIQTLGYHPSTYFDIRDENIDIKHVPPFITGEGPYLELHWTILEENEPFTIDAEGLWDRAIPAQIAGVDVLALGYEDLILHLCLHMTYQHHLAIGLRNLYDIFAVIKQHQDNINWDLLVKIAHSWGAERVIWLTLSLLDEILDYKISDDILYTLLDDEIPAKIFDSAIAYLLDDGQMSNNLTPDLIRLSDKNGIFPKFKLILSRIFITKQALARVYNIPTHSARIYLCYFQRFIDLFKQYAGSAWQLITRKQSALANTHDLDRNVQLVKWLAKK